MPGDLLFFSRFIADDISANVGSGMLDASESVVAESLTSSSIETAGRVDRWSFEQFMEMFIPSLQSALEIRQRESILIVDDRRWFGAV